MSRKRIYHRPVKPVHNNWLLAGLLLRLNEPPPPLPKTEGRIHRYLQRLVKWVRRS